MASRPSPSPDPDFVLRGSTSPLTCVLHTSRGVVTGSQDGEILVWDLRTRRSKQQINAHPGGVTTLIAYKNEIYSQGRDGCIKQWNSDWESTVCITGSTKAFCAAVHLYKDIVAMPTSSNQSDVAIISLETKKISRVLSPKSGDGKGYGMVMCLKSLWRETSATKALLLAGYENGRIILWNTELAQELSQLDAHAESVLCLDYSEVLQRGISGSVDEQLMVWTLTKDDQLRAFNKVEVTNPGINFVLFRDDGKIVVTGGWDGQVRVFSGKTFRPLAVLTCHKEAVRWLSFDKDHSFLAVSTDCTVSSWNIYKNK